MIASFMLVLATFVLTFALVAFFVFAATLMMFAFAFMFFAFTIVMIAFLHFGFHCCLVLAESLSCGDNVSFLSLVEVFPVGY